MEGAAEKDIVLDTEADVIKNKANIIKQVTAGNMPFGDPSWKNTAEAQVLLDWLKALAPQPVP